MLGLRRAAGRHRRERPGRPRSPTVSARSGTGCNTGPLHVSDQQINDYIQKAQDSLSKKAEDGAFLSQATNIGSALTHILAGLFLVLFSTYFFLADGDRIWAWFVRIAPRAARARVDSSGRVAWISLTQFVRATVIVAVTDAVGVMIAASILQVPFVLAIGVLVFLGAFVPIVGAFVAGTVAVLVALVDHGIVVALLMLGAVVLVQQIESHVLQPFLMGRFVSIHPLGVIIAIAPASCSPASPAPWSPSRSLPPPTPSSSTWRRETAVGEDPEAALEDDYAETGEHVETDAETGTPRTDGASATPRTREWPTSSTPTARTAARCRGQRRGARWLTRARSRCDDIERAAELIKASPSGRRWRSRGGSRR